MSRRHPVRLLMSDRTLLISAGIAVIAATASVLIPATHWASYIVTTLALAGGLVLVAAFIASTAGDIARGDAYEEFAVARQKVLEDSLESRVQAAQALVNANHALAYGRYRALNNYRPVEQETGHE